jgi:hypothetical protein
MIRMMTDEYEATNDMVKPYYSENLCPTTLTQAFRVRSWQAIRLVCGTELQLVPQHLSSAVQLTHMEEGTGSFAKLSLHCKVPVAITLTAVFENLTFFNEEAVSITWSTHTDGEVVHTIHIQILCYLQVLHLSLIP